MSWILISNIQKLLLLLRHQQVFLASLGNVFRPSAANRGRSIRLEVIAGKKESIGVRRLEHLARQRSRGPAIARWFPSLPDHVLHDADVVRLGPLEDHLLRSIVVIKRSVRTFADDSALIRAIRAVGTSIPGGRTFRRKKGAKRGVAISRIQRQDLFAIVEIVGRLA